METRVKKWGNSLGIRIPQAVISELGLREDSRVDLKIRRKQLIVEFAMCHQNKITVDVDGVCTNFIDLEGLKNNKRASVRLQDLADLETLSSAQPK